MSKTKQIKALTDLTPDPHNANKGTERGATGLKNSLREYGAGRSILVDRNGVVIAGNKTLEQAKAMGIEVETVRTSGDRLVVVQRDDLDLDADPRARELAIADNRIAEADLDWDVDELKREMDEGIDLAKFWNDDELKEMLDIEPPEPPPDPGAQIDKADELRETWQTERGQLWVIPSKSVPGKEHRLLCGDSTSEADVARLMGGEKAGLMATDPPYGVDFSGAKYNPRAKEWDGIEGDKRKGDELRDWLHACLLVWFPFIDERSSFYFWTAAMEEGAAAAAAIRASGLHIQSQIIWNKNTLILGQADYQWKHENCWYAFWKGKKHRWFGGRAQTTVWDLSKIANGSYQHPMQKPCELYAVPIRNHTSKGDICAEPFSGSGSQFIAAEQLGRLCYGIEIEPKYVAVALQRLADMGLEPRRSEAANG